MDELEGEELEVHVRGEGDRERPDTIFNNCRIASPSNLPVSKACLLRVRHDPLQDLPRALIT